MNSKINQREMSRLKNILFPKNKTVQTNITQLDETHETKHQLNKQNLHATNTANTNLKEQMKKLKYQVDNMLNQNQNLDYVMNTTTRYYLQKIKKISNELGYQSVESILQASENLINNLPIKKKTIYTVRNEMENIVRRLFCRKIQKIYTNIRKKNMYQAFYQMDLVYKQKKCKVHRNIIDIQKLSQSFRKWRYHNFTENLEQKKMASQDGINSLTKLLQNFLNQPHLIISLNNLIRQEADFSQILIYNREQSKLYTYIEAGGNIHNSHLQSVSSSIYDRIKTNQVQKIEIKKYEFELEDSLTKICICRKQIIKIDQIQQDRDYSTCDMMTSQQMQSFRPISMGAVFIPLINLNKEVIGVLRLYYLQNIKNQIDSRITELFGGIIEATKKMSKRMKQIKKQKKQQKAQIFCKIIKLLKVIESSQSLNQLYQNFLVTLRSIFYLQGISILKYQNKVLRLLYSSSNVEISNKKYLLTCLKVMQQKNESLVEVQNVKLIRIGQNKNIRGILQLIQPMADIQTEPLEKLMIFFWNKLNQLQKFEEQKKEIEKKNIQNQKKIKKIKNKKIVKDHSVKFLDCDSYQQLLMKFHAFISQINPRIKFAQIFINQGNNHYFVLGRKQGYKLYTNQNQFIKKILKNKKFSINNFQEFYHQILNYSLNFGLYSSDLTMFNFQVKINNHLEYIVSIGSQTSQISDELEQELVMFINCLKVLSNQKIKSQQSMAEDKILVLKNIYNQIFYEDPIKFLQNYIEKGFGGASKVIQYDYNKLIYKNKQYKIKNSKLLEIVIQQSIIQLPQQPLTKNRLIIQNQGLNKQLKKININTLQQFKDQLQVFTQLFETKIQNITLLATSFQDRIYIIAILCKTILKQHKQVYQEIVKMFNYIMMNCKRYKNIMENNQLKLKFKKIRDVIDKFHRNILSASYKKIKNFQRKPKKSLINFQILNSIYKLKIANAFIAIKHKSINNKYLLKKCFNFNNMKIFILRLDLTFKNCIKQCFENLKQKNNKSTKIIKGGKNLLQFMNGYQKKILNWCYIAIKYEKKYFEQPQKLQKLIRIINKRQLNSFYKIKNHNLNNYDCQQSYLSTFNFEPKLNLWSKIFQKLQTINEFQFAIQNKHITQYIINHPTKGIITVKNVDQDNNQIFKIQFNRYNILWLYQENFQLTLESKHYLQVLTKAIVQNIKPYHNLMQPAFFKLKQIYKYQLRHIKMSALSKWRAEILKDYKKIQYSNIQKAYRLNQQLFTFKQIREKKKLQHQRKSQQIESLNNHITSSTVLIEHEKSEITKMNKYICTNQMMTKLFNIQFLKMKKKNYFQKWRNTILSKQQQIQKFNQFFWKNKHTCIKSASTILKNIFKKKFKFLKNQSFKYLAINYVQKKDKPKSIPNYVNRADKEYSMVYESSHLEGNNSPIKKKEYQSLFTRNSANLLASFNQHEKNSKIMKIEPILIQAQNIQQNINYKDFSNGGSIIRNKRDNKVFYISENNNNKKNYSVDPNNSSKRKVLEEKSFNNQYNSDLNTSEISNLDQTPTRFNYSNIGNIKQRMLIHNQTAFQYDNSISQEKKKMLGYKLSNQTIRFLKKFGRDITPNKDSSKKREKTQFQRVTRLDKKIFDNSHQS